MLGNDKPKELSLRYPKDTLIGVQFDFEVSEAGERRLWVVNHLVSLFRFDDVVVDVDLNIFSDMVAKTSVHASLKCCPVFLSPNGMVT